MSTINEQLAALAVFSELVNNGKDIYSVLWEFIKSIIKKRALTESTITQLNDFLKEDYNFNNIPNAVLKTLLRKHPKNEVLLEGEKITFFPVVLKAYENNGYEQETQTQKQAFSAFFEDIKHYICEQEGYENTTDEQILKSIRIYLLDETKTTKLSELINRYIIETQTTKQEIPLVLNQIKEGYILYDGVCWSDNLNELGRWKNQLTLFYDMDIIFYLAGYSGEIFYSVFDEMHKLIQEINGSYAKKGKDKCIRTYYFPEVEEQIDNYFKNAVYIVNAKKDLDPSETAMKYIVSHCPDTSSVIRMQTDLKDKLQKFGIVKYPNTDYYQKEQYQFNVESEDVVQRYEKKGERAKVERYLRRINYISVLRKDHDCQKFTNCEYLMITRNNICMQMDKDADTHLRQQFLRVLSPEVITSRFWFQLNKGLQGCKMPISLDVLAQAKIILGHQVNKNISECYEKLKAEYEKEDADKELIISQIAELRKYSLLPEDISLEVAAETKNLAESDVTDWIKKRNQELEQQMEREQYYSNLEKENEALKIETTNERLLAEEQMAASREKQSIIESQEQQIENMQMQMEELQFHVKNLEEQENNREKKIQKRKHILSFIVRVIILLLLIGITVYLFINKYEVLAAISTLITVLGSIGGLVKSWRRKGSQGND